MIKEKQELWLKFLASGKYRVNSEKGKIETYRPKTKEWLPLSGSKLPSGYIQHNLNLGLRSGYYLCIYEHIAVWIAVKGVYEPGLVVNHLDLNRSNNGILNLEVCTQQENIQYSINIRNPKIIEPVLQNVSNLNSDIELINKYHYKPEISKPKLIRTFEIKEIRKLLSEGESQIAIATKLGLNRCAVGYICRKIKAGEVLKYEIF